MNDSALIALTALCMLVILFLTGCETLRIGLATDFGTFSYVHIVFLVNDGSKAFSFHGHFLGMGVVFSI